MQEVAKLWIETKMDFAVRLNEDERKRGVKANCKGLGLIGWNDGVALTEMGQLQAHPV